MKMHTLAFPAALILFGSLILVEGAKDKVFPFGDEFGHASDKNCKEFSEGKEGALLGVACEDAVRWLLNETGTNFIQAFPQLSDDWCGCFVKDVKKGKCDKIKILADGTCDTEAPTKSPSDSPSLIPSSSPSDLPSFKPSTSPSSNPTLSAGPSSNPSSSPSTTLEPTSTPSSNPTTAQPTSTPSWNPTTAEPTPFPTTLAGEASAEIPRVFMTYWFPIGTDIPSGAVEGAVNNMMQEMTEGEFGPASLDLETRVVTDAILGIGTVSTEGTWTGERRDKPTESSFVAAFNFWAIDEFKTALSEDGYPIDRVDVQVNGNLLVLPSAEQRPGQQQPLNNPSEAKSGGGTSSGDKDDRNKNLQLVAYLFLAPLGLFIVVIAICCCMDISDKNVVEEKIAMGAEAHSSSADNVLNATNETEPITRTVGAQETPAEETSIGTDDTSVFTSGMTGLSMVDPMAEVPKSAFDGAHHRASESPVLPVGYALFPDDERYLDDIDSKNNLLLGALGDLEAPESDDEDVFVDEDTIGDMESHNVTSTSLHASDVHSLSSNTMYVSSPPSVADGKNETKDPPANSSALQPFEEMPTRNIEIHPAVSDDDQTRTSYLEY